MAYRVTGDLVIASTARPEMRSRGGSLNTCSAFVGVISPVSRQQLAISNALSLIHGFESRLPIRRADFLNVHPRTLFARHQRPRKRLSSSESWQSARRQSPTLEIAVRFRQQSPDLGRSYNGAYTERLK